MALFRIYRKGQEQDTVAYIEAQNKTAVLREIVENGYSRNEFEIECVEED